MKLDYFKFQKQKKQSLQIVSYHLMYTTFIDRIFLDELYVKFPPYATTWDKRELV